MELSFTLSMNDLLKDAHRIHEFRGNDEYALTSFLREVDTLFLLVQGQPDVKQYIYQRIIINKIQGEALHVLRTLGANPNWEETKQALISNFGVKQSYHQLYQEAFEAKNNCIVSYYKYLRDILCKINEKYEYDVYKPIEFSPTYAEKIILKTFINNIDVNLASVIINRNLTKLRDAFNLLENEGLIRNKFEERKTNVDRSNKNNNKAYRNGENNLHNNTGENINNRTLDSRSNSYQYRNQSNVRSSPSNVQNLGRNNVGLNNGNSYNDRRLFQPMNRSVNFRQNGTQMDVDHLQEGEGEHNAEEEVNFLTIAPSQHFP